MERKDVNRIDWNCKEGNVGAVEEEININCKSGSWLVVELAATTLVLVRPEWLPASSRPRQNEH